MFLDSDEQTQILHSAYLNVRMFPIDFPTLEPYSGTL